MRDAEDQASLEANLMQVEANNRSLAEENERLKERVESLRDIVREARRWRRAAFIVFAVYAINAIAWLIFAE